LFHTAEGASSSRVGASRHNITDKVGHLSSTTDEVRSTRQKIGAEARDKSASLTTRSQQRTKDLAGAGSEKTRPERGQRNDTGGSGRGRKRQRAESTSSASSDTSSTTSSSSSGGSTSSGSLVFPLHLFHSDRQYRQWAISLFDLDFC